MSLRFYNFSNLRFFTVCALVLPLTACSGGGAGGIGSGDSSASLTWLAPSERADNTSLPLEEIAGYRIYYGIEQGDYLGRIVIDGGKENDYTLEGIPSGKYFVVMTTVDTEGRESVWSEPAIEINAM